MGESYTGPKLKPKYAVGIYVDHKETGQKFGYIFAVDLTKSEPMYGIEFYECMGWFCESEIVEVNHNE